jgi:hypothetical protein
MVLRQTTGFVESLLQLIGLDWSVPNFSTYSRRQKTLKVNFPYRGTEGPLHLLTDIEPARTNGSTEPAKGSRSKAKATETPISTASRSVPRHGHSNR